MRWVEFAGLIGLIIWDPINLGVLRDHNNPTPPPNAVFDIFPA